jgi:hypothetical protein
MKSVVFLFFAILLVGCSENKSSDTDNLIGNTPTDEYAPGEVAFGLQDTVSLEHFAAYIYSLSNISIDEIVFFQYSSSLSQDSVQILKSVLESKPYIDSRSTRISHIGNETEIIVELWIKDFKSEYQSDWLFTINQFKLSHYPNHFQGGILKVEVGKEKEWIDYLSKNELFRYVEPNYIIRTH